MLASTVLSSGVCAFSSMSENGERARNSNATVNRMRLEVSEAAASCRDEDGQTSSTFGQIDVLFVILPHSLLLDIAGPAEAFRLANQHRERRGESPRFRLRFASADPSLSTSVGLTVAGLIPLPQRLSTSTWVVVVGQPTAHTREVT